MLIPLVLRDAPFLITVITATARSLAIKRALYPFSSGREADVVSRWLKLKCIETLLGGDSYSARPSCLFEVAVALREEGLLPSGFRNPLRVYLYLLSVWELRRHTRSSSVGSRASSC